jgi:quercetin dioxygenase-like cupin family protein
MESQKNIFELLMKQRDEEREAKKTAKVVVKGKELPLEMNRMGLFRWYLHPYQKDAAHRALLIWVQEIPPGSRSGKQKTQGGRIHYVLEGRGYTEVDGVRHEWKQGDMILLPIKTYGVVYQHVNSDPKAKARIVAAEPNIYAGLGVDLGSGFEQLEDSPDCKP